MTMDWHLASNDFSREIALTAKWSDGTLERGLHLLCSGRGFLSREFVTAISRKNTQTARNRGQSALHENIQY